MRISDWSSDVCSSDLLKVGCLHPAQELRRSCPFRFARKARRRKGRIFRPVPPDESGQDRSLGIPEQQARRLKRAGIARKKGMAPPCPSALRRSTRLNTASGSISVAAPSARQDRQGDVKGKVVAASGDPGGATQHKKK